MIDLYTDLANITGLPRDFIKRRILRHKYDFRLNTIVKTKSGYVVMSESKGPDGKRKRLSKPYKTRAEAQRRLNQIDYFKAHKQ